MERKSFELAEWLREDKWMSIQEGDLTLCWR